MGSHAIASGSVAYRLLVKAAALWCAVAVGMLLFSAVVAPMLFQALPHDRATAGRIAGRGFEVAYAVTCAAALVCIASAVATRRMARVDIATTFAMLVGAVMQLAWIAPSIMRRGVGWPWSFASLHAVGGVLHVCLAACALALAWRLLSRS